MTKFGRIALALTLSLISLALTLVLMPCAGQNTAKGDSSALMPYETSSDQITATVTVLVDDYAPQPKQGESFWYYNRLGGDRGPIGDESPPANTKVYWGKGVVTATITGTSIGVGVWTALNHPIVEHNTIDFSAIFPPQIKTEFQGRFTGLGVKVMTGTGTFQVEIKGYDASLSQETTLWSQSVPLIGGPQNLSFDLSSMTITEVQNINWLVMGSVGDSVVVDQMVLTTTLPQLSTEQQAFLWSYAMLLNNWDPDSGLTRDRACWLAGEDDNISASGMQAAAAVMAWRLGFISWDSATEIVSKTSQALLDLPRCNGLWPHFVKQGDAAPGAEWSSIDTIIALVALAEARQALSLDTAQVETALKDIEWQELILHSGTYSGTISHGYAYSTTCPTQPMQIGWGHFGAESWLVNLGYAAATGNTAVFTHTPPTYNGSGFIDELAWLLAPAPDIDRWGTRWSDYRQWAVDNQIDYYQSHPCYAGPPRLFGLSAAEVPDPSAVPTSQIYQAFGVGGVISPNDGTDLLEHAVIAPHYAGLAALLRPDQSRALWEWLETEELFTSLNNVESLMFTDEPTSCVQVTWNALKGSWNLSLQTLGWGRHLLGDNNLLYHGMWANGMLEQGYRTMIPWVAINDYPVFAYPGQPVTVTVAWGNIPTNSRYKLRVQLENKFLKPDVYYAWTDVFTYSATETQAITFTIPVTIPDPSNAIPRYGSRFVAAFISKTVEVEWGDVLARDDGLADVTIESAPPVGWTSGQFHLADPYTGTFLDPEGRSFYVQGMTYAYEKPAEITAAVVLSQLARMKALGLNAVNLYPRFGFNTDTGLADDFLPEILSWADHNRMAVYIRPWYKHAPEYPDYMDPQYRQQAKDSLETVLDLARPHPSVLAVDLDHRWLFDVDWWGNRRYGVPQLMPYTLAYLPTWLQDRFDTLDVLNAAWGKNYITFTNVLTDSEIVPHGRVIDLEMHPWRVDLLEYTLWVMDDFMTG